MSGIKQPPKIRAAEYKNNAKRIHWIIYEVESNVKA